jgi:hypothetical protein
MENFIHPKKQTNKKTKQKQYKIVLGTYPRSFLFLMLNTRLRKMVISVVLREVGAGMRNLGPVLFLNCMNRKATQSWHVSIRYIATTSQL